MKTPRPRCLQVLPLFSSLFIGCDALTPTLPADNEVLEKRNRYEDR